MTVSRSMEAVARPPPVNRMEDDMELLCGRRKMFRRGAFGPADTPGHRSRRHVMHLLEPQYSVAPTLAQEHFAGAIAGTQVMPADKVINQVQAFENHSCRSSSIYR